MKTSFKNRFQYALDYRNMRMSDIERITNISKASLSQYYNGLYEPKQDRIYLISKALNVNPAWLLGYDVPMDAKDIEDIADITYLPYMGTISAGNFEYTTDNDDKTLISVPNDILKEDSSHYFILQANGDSMNKDIANGHFVVILDFSKANNISFSPNDILVINEGNSYTMKRVRKTDTKVYLEPNSYFDGFKTKIYSIDDFSELKIIGKVIYSFKRWRV